MIKMGRGENYQRETPVKIDWRSDVDATGGDDTRDEGRYAIRIRSYIVSNDVFHFCPSRPPFSTRRTSQKLHTTEKRNARELIDDLSHWREHVDANGGEIDSRATKEEAIKPSSMVLEFIFVRARAPPPPRQPRAPSSALVYRMRYDRTDDPYFKKNKTICSIWGSNPWRQRRFALSFVRVRLHVPCPTFCIRVTNIWNLNHISTAL